MSKNEKKSLQHLKKTGDSLAQESVKQKAQRLGMHYLQLKGYNGFSFQDIADDLGIRKASLHYYFASKEDLGIEILNDYIRAFDRWTQAKAHLSAEEKIFEMIELFAKMSEKNFKICPIGALCADYMSLSEKFKKQIMQFFELEKTWMIKTLAQGQKENYIRKDINTDLAAEALMAQIQGGVQIARLKGNAQGFRKITRSAVEVLLVRPKLSRL